MSKSKAQCVENFNNMCRLPHIQKTKNLLMFELIFHAKILVIKSHLEVELNHPQLMLASIVLLLLFFRY